MTSDVDIDDATSTPSRSTRRRAVDAIDTGIGEATIIGKIIAASRGIGAKQLAQQRAYENLRKLEPRSLTGKASGETDGANIATSRDRAISF